MSFDDIVVFDDCVGVFEEVFEGRLRDTLMSFGVFLDSQGTLC